jgi:hypothetical protein
MTMAITLFAVAGAVLLTAAAVGQSEEDFEVGDIPDTYVRPVYPAGVTIDGSCGAFFEVRPDGGVDMISLSVSCTDPVFVPSLEEAMAQWRFDPTIVDGRPIAMTGYSARIKFSGGGCVRVSSGNRVDSPCALAQQ